MTKLIRIENADNSNHKVMVEVYDKSLNDEAPYLVKSMPLDNPTQMISEYVYGNRYIVIRENDLSIY